MCHRMALHVRRGYRRSRILPGVTVGLDTPISLPPPSFRGYHELAVAPLEREPLLAGLRGS